MGPCVKDLDAKKMAALLCRMQLPTKIGDNGMLRVEVPPTRSDVLHPCDIAEAGVVLSFHLNRALGTL